MNKVLKYIWISYDLIGAPIAYKLLKEGCEVKVCQIQNNWEIGNQDKPEKPDVRKKRLSLYDGVFPKMSLQETLIFMRGIKNKDEWFVVIDFNNLWKISEQVLKMGFKQGFFPTKEDFELEKDRKKGKELVEKYYDLDLGEVTEYKKSKDAIDYIQKSKNTFVLKGYDLTADTICPTDKIDELARLKLIKTLEKDPKNYESKGFILEKKIKEPIEITPEAQFYNGKLVMMTVDIESKAMNAGDEGKQTGCSQNLVIKMEEGKLSKLAFPPIVQEMASKHVGLFVWDASILFKDKAYFGEFCANRWGWDSIQTELAMCESVSGYFEGIVKGKNPLKYKYGFAVRGFNDDIHEKEYCSERQMAWMEETDRDTWVYDMKNKDKEIVNTGYCEADLVVFTGQGNTSEEATKKAFKSRENFSFSNMTTRPSFDWNASYPTSIYNRLKYLEKYEKETK